MAWNSSVGRCHYIEDDGWTHINNIRNTKMYILEINFKSRIHSELQREVISRILEEQYSSIEHLRFVNENGSLRIISTHELDIKKVGGYLEKTIGLKTSKNPPRKFFNLSTSGSLSIDFPRLNALLAGFFMSLGILILISAYITKFIHPEYYTSPASIPYDNIFHWVLNYGLDSSFVPTLIIVIAGLLLSRAFGHRVNQQMFNFAAPHWISKTARILTDFLVAVFVTLVLELIYLYVDNTEFIWILPVFLVSGMLFMRPFASIYTRLDRLDIGSMINRTAYKLIKFLPETGPHNLFAKGIISVLQVDYSRLVLWLVVLTASDLRSVIIFVAVYEVIDNISSLVEKYLTDNYKVKLSSKIVNFYSNFSSFITGFTGLAAMVALAKYTQLVDFDSYQFLPNVQILSVLVLYVALYLVLGKFVKREENFLVNALKIFVITPLYIYAIAFLLNTAIFL